MMKTIKAFFQHMPPFPGAAALRGQSIAEALSSHLNEENLIIYCSNSNASPINGVSVKPLNVALIHNHAPLFQRIWGEVNLGLEAARNIFFVGDRPDFVLISSPSYISAMILCLLSKILQVPYILELRDIYPAAYVEASLLKKGSYFEKFFSFMSRFMYRNAQLIVCATNGLGRSVNFEEPMANVRCAYNGFPAQFIERKANKFSRFTVCFHGVLGFFQDVESLVSVAAALEVHDVDVVVIGYGRKENALRDCHSPNLRFLGELPFNETISHIERCHVGLCLRNDDLISRDSFPVKVWEYLGLAIPMIVTPTCEAGDFILSHNCGIVHSSGDIDGIVSSIISLKENRELLYYFIRNCENVRHYFTREATGATVANFIAEVAGLAYAEVPSRIPAQTPRL